MKPEPRPKDDQFVAALCHAGFVLPFIGAVVPFIIWLSQRERSSYLRFQALQAFAYQLLAVLVYVLYYFGQIIIVLFLFPPALILSSTESQLVSQIVVSIAFAIFSLVALLQFVIFCIGGPLYLGLGFVATWRVLQGHDFHYPLLGKLVERVANRRSAQAKDGAALAESDA